MHRRVGSASGSLNRLSISAVGFDFIGKAPPEFSAAYGDCETRDESSVDTPQAVKTDNCRCPRPRFVDARSRVSASVSAIERQTLARDEERGPCSSASRVLQPHASGSAPRRSDSDHQPRACGDHRRSPVMDGVDDLGGVDPVEKTEVTPRLIWPSWRLIAFRGTPSRPSRPLGRDAAGAARSDAAARLPPQFALCRSPGAAWCGATRGAGRYARGHARRSGDIGRERRRRLVCRGRRARGLGARRPPRPGVLVRGTGEPGARRRGYSGDPRAVAAEGAGGLRRAGRGGGGAGGRDRRGDGIQALIEVTHFTHPGCPSAYSAWPGHTTLRWRYGVQLRWTLVVIGLTEDAAQYAARGYTPTRSAIGYGRFRRFAMRFQITPKARLSATAPACRAIVATRLAAPPLEDAALRALQFAQFTTTGRRAPDRAAVPRARLRRGA